MQYYSIVITPPGGRERSVRARAHRSYRSAPANKTMRNDLQVANLQIADCTLSRAEIVIGRTRRVATWRRLSLDTYLRHTRGSHVRPLMSSDNIPRAIRTNIASRIFSIVTPLSSFFSLVRASWANRRLRDDLCTAVGHHWIIRFLTQYPDRLSVDDGNSTIRFYNYIYKASMCWILN